jgi:hypothetical protein
MQVLMLFVEIRVVRNVRLNHDENQIELGRLAYAEALKI